MSKNALLTKEAGKVIGDMLKGNSTLKELDLSSNRDYYAGATDGPGFAQELADGIKDNGALSSVNVLFNNIGTEQAQALANILKEHPTLKSLCGNKGNETELDMSGEPYKRLGAEGAIMLAPEIIDNGAMTSLNVSNNSLGIAAGWAFSSQP